MVKTKADGRTYCEKLRDPRWQRRRLQVLEQCGFECTNCGDSTSELHVHHVAYRRGADPWDYGDDELTTLCANCHQLEEASRKLASERIGKEVTWRAVAYLIEHFDRNDDGQCSLFGLLESLTEAIHETGSPVLVADILGRASRLGRDNAIGLLLVKVATNCEPKTGSQGGA